MPMDLNELLHQHQAAVMRAAAAGAGTERDDHFAKVAEYAARVRALRRIDPGADTPAQVEGPPTIIYGTYAGENAQPSDGAPIASWEDEGGAVRHPHIPLPEGIDMKLVREYRVGPYVYHDLDLAVAEHLRQLAAQGDGTA